ncbi:MAG: hypothetical protein KC912_17785 [Proteobacteria bacterium]|nr:hypothetical protein [Pseudomonadota bacterium]
MSGPPEEWLEARGDLLPVLRGVSRPPGSLTRLATEPRTAPIRRPAAPFLSELVVWDGPHTRHYITPKHLEMWQVDGHRVFHQARANMPATQGLTRKGPFFQLDAGDGYDASRLILPGWLEAFAEMVDGVPVAAAPDARTLLVCGSEDTEAIEELLRIGYAGYRRAGDPVSPGLYTSVDGELAPYLVSEGPLAPLLRRNQLVLAGQQYRLQKHEIDHDAHLADFSVFVGPQFAVSLAQLRQGVTTLLPVVDFIVLETADGSTRTVEWAVLPEHVETRVHGDLVPPRLEVSSFPDDLDALPEAPIRITLK